MCLAKARARQLRQAGITVDRVSLPTEFNRYWSIVQKLCAYGLYQNHGTLLTEYADQCSPSLKSWLQRGQSISDKTYQQACQWRDRYCELLTPVFAQYDTVLSPVTTGPAPLGLINTGSPIFCGLWITGPEYLPGQNDGWFTAGLSTGRTIVWCSTATDHCPPMLVHLKFCFWRDYPASGVTVGEA